jgi:hypothetical protein
MQPGYPSWQNEALTLVRLVFLVLPRATLLQPQELKIGIGAGCRTEV